MREVFWIALALVGYAYVGYPLLLALLARRGGKPIAKAAILPTLSIIMAARNEERTLERKLANLDELDYPPALVQRVIASDGSSDRTAEILRQHAGPVVPVVLAKSVGKAGALNEAVRHATGDLLVFLDVRQTVEPSALRELAANFADPAVGAVSGELLLQDADGTPAGDALGLYWKLEKLVRRFESATGSVVGVTGAIYAMRRELFTELPLGLILDDVLVPMRVAQRGRRVIFEPKAIARDRIFAEPGKEFSRKVRTLTGNYQMLRHAPWILSPADPLLFRFVSHKLMRLLVPGLLLVLLLSSFLLRDETIYRTLFFAQMLLYCLAALGSASPASRRLKLVAVAYTFAMLNAAAAAAWINFVRRKDEVWT